MQRVGVAELASAVSNAGGLGILTALTQPSPDALRAEIERCKSMTTKPFAVNITVFPSMNSPDYVAYAEAALDAGVRIFETAGTSAVSQVWETLQKSDTCIIHKCTAVRHAVSAEKKGIQAISIDGFECAGHPGEDDIPGLILIPCTADKVKIPILASGGFGDGRGLIAALALGADGINMGTRFCATQEAVIHPNVKQAYVDNDERATNLIFRNFKNTARCAKNGVSDEVVRRLGKPDVEFSDVAELVSGAKGAVVLESGDLEAGIFWASMVQGLIHDIPTCKQLINRIMDQASGIVASRLAGLCQS